MSYLQLPQKDTQVVDGKHEEFRRDWEEHAPLRRSRSSSPDSLTLSRSFICPIHGRRKATQWSFLVFIPWLLNVSLCFVVIYLSLSARGSNPQPEPSICEYGSKHPADRYTPATEAIEYIPVVFKVTVGRDVSPYQGLPNDEKDVLWDELYGKGITFAIDEETNSKLYNKTENIPIWGREREHLGGLDVFHQLYCLDMIRMAFYPKRYGTAMVHPNGTVDYLQWLPVDHCIESLRQSVICHSDVSMNGFFWMDRSKSLEPQMQNVHMCRNFSKIQEWAFSRYVDVLTGDKLRSHVEDGVVVDYSSVPELDPTLAIPKDWNLTVDDL